MKIFVIGMNKTGTTSLHQAFEILRIKSLHWAPELHDQQWRSSEATRIQKEMGRRVESEDPNPLGPWDEYDAYSDIYPISEHFKTFYVRYPRSKFIYTDRDDQSWLRSREKHIQRNLAAKAKGNYHGNFLTIDREKWLRQKHDHLERAKNFFNSERKEALLYFNVFRGDGFDSLCSFLGVEKPSQDFPWVNKARE